MSLRKFIAVCLLLPLALPASSQAWKHYFTSYTDTQAGTLIKPLNVVAAKDGGAFALGDVAITRLGPTGSVVWTTPYFAQYASRAVLAECSDGFYVVGYANRSYPPPQLTNPDAEVQLTKYDASGHFVFSKLIGPKISTDPGALSCLVDSSDGIYISDGTNLVKCDANGAIKWNYALFPTQFKLDNDGNLIVVGSATQTSGYVAKYTPDGQFVWEPQLTLPGVFQNSSFAVGADDSIYAAFSYAGYGERLIKVSTAGTTVWSVDVPNRQDVSVTANTDGTIALLDSATNTVGCTTISAAGAVISIHETPGGGVGVYADGSGNNYFLSPPGTRIDKFNSSGAKVGTFDVAGVLGLPANALSAISFQNGGVYCLQWDGVTNAPSNLGAARTTLSGSVVWSSAGTTNKSTTIQSVQGLVTSAGKTFMIGLSSAIASPDFSEAIAAFDASGNVLFSKITPTIGVPSQMLLESDGGFVAGGSTGLSRFNPSGVLQWTAAVAVKEMGMDSAGNILGVGNQGSAFKVSPTGTILWTVGTGYSLGAVDPAGNLYAKNTSGFQKISPAGTVLYTKTFLAGSLINGAFDATCDAAGNQYYTCQNATEGTQFGAIAKLDTNGSELWESSFVAGVNSFANKGIYDPNTAKVYLVGYRLVNGFDLMSAGRFDAVSGNLEWTNSFPLGKASQGTQASLDSQGHLLVGGWDYTAASSYDNVLLRVNPISGALEQTEIFDSGVQMSEDQFTTEHSSSGRPFGGGIGADTSGFAYQFGNSIGPDQAFEFQVTKYGPPPPDDATITQVAASPMAAGQTYSVSVTASNVGLNAWTSASGYKLDCLESSTWRAASAALSPTDNIANAQAKTFSINVAAPLTPGTYPLQWRMEHNGTQFGTPSPLLNIIVVAQTDFATFISQTVPTTMVAGQTYPFSILYQNRGTNTWTVEELQSQHGVNNITWGTSRLALVNGPVAPGATGNFGGGIIAPMSSGTYNFQWQPINETTGLNFSTLTPNVEVVVTQAVNAARFISRTGATGVYAGSDFYVQNTMMNVGTGTWKASTGFSMMSVNPNNNTTWGGNRIPIPTSVLSVATGVKVTFTKLCTAPSTPGTYTMQWQMDLNGVPFGDTTPLLHITVYPTADNSQFVSQTAIPTSIGPSVTFGATFTMKNVGTATWSSAYSLAPVGTNNFGVAGIASGSVAPNANGTFTGTFTAPAAPGTYTFQWRMKHGTTLFGQASTAVTIVVGADSSQFVSRSGATSVFAGADFYATYTMKNTGTTSWTAGAGYFMTILPSGSTTWTANRINIPGSVAPGASFTNSALCTAPVTPGTYTMQWQMSKSGVVFGEKTPITTINVFKGADDARFVTQSGIPTNITHGTTFTAIIIMGNLGTATWDGTYTLVSVGSNNFGHPTLPITLTDQNNNSSFQATFTAPVTPGTYTFQFRMQHGTTKFGQPTLLVTVHVV